MQLPTLAARAPIDEAFAIAREQELLQSIDGLGLHDALSRYHEFTENALKAALGGTSLACGPSCTPCCHQPLLVSFLELGELVFSDEPRFTSAAFRESLRAENKALRGFRERSKGEGAVGIARAQFKERRPCVLLSEGGLCTAYDARPFLCRNAYAVRRCTFDHLDSFGFGDLAALARRLRGALHRAYSLDRFDTPKVAVSRAAFYLPEGLAWFLDDLPRDAVRAAFLSPGSAGPPGGSTR